MAKRSAQSRQEAVEGRWSKRYKRTSARFRADCERVKAPCHLCGQAIDYTLVPGEGDHYETDHFYPVSTHPHLFEEPSNYRPSHSSCNRSRGSKEVVPLLGPPSESW